MILFFQISLSMDTMQTVVESMPLKAPPKKLNLRSKKFQKLFQNIPQQTYTKVT